MPCGTCQIRVTGYGCESVIKVHRSGGFADVSQGEYLGRQVAVKQLRLWAKDEVDKIFKVLELY